MEVKYTEPLFLKFENENIPEFREIRSKDWIYYGSDNLWPDYVIDLYQRSAKHNAIINGKVNYIVGQGFDEGDNKWIKKVNSYESLKDLAVKLAIDLELFNGFAIEPIYGLGGKIVEMYHVPFNKIRTNKDESKYFYSENWNDTNQSKEESNFKEFIPFKFGKKGKQLYVFTLKTPRKTGEPNVYPIPEYMGALSAIETDVEISNFHLTNIKTGFSAGTMINLLNGTPTEEEAKKLEKKFKDKFTGTNRAGSYMLNFAIDKEHAAEVVHLQPSDLDKQYAQLADRVNQEIFTGHKVTSPTLFGVATPGALGQRNEMLDAYELFMNTYIDIRKTILENTFNKIFVLNGMSEIKFKPKNILNKLESKDIVSNLSNDEVRELAGFGKTEITETERMLASINSISPIVANKVIESMTLNEIRTLVGLKPTTEPIPQPVQMKAQEDILQVFSKYGKSKKEYDSIKSRRVSFKSEADLYKNELLGIAMAEELDSNEIEIKDLPKGKTVLPKRTSLKVMYSYEWRKGFNNADYPTSREFCQALMDLDRYYSRADIEQISDEVGYDAFAHRGGYYNDPKTGRTLPYCRHEWTMHVLIKK